MKLMRVGLSGFRNVMAIGCLCMWIVNAAVAVQRPGDEGNKNGNAANATPTDGCAVEIQINVPSSETTDDEKDDYVCLTTDPDVVQTRCRAKLMKAFICDVAVDLKDETGGGEVRFPGDTDVTKTITLNSDGSTWTEFYISGKTVSSAKDDAKIAAYKTGAETKLGDQDLTVVDIDLAAIKFNHKGPDKDTGDGLIINKSYGVSLDHKDHTYGGEWVPTLPRNEPFLYVVGNTVTIKAQFETVPKCAGVNPVVSLSAVAASGFPDVVAKSVSFVDGLSVGDTQGYVEFSVTKQSHEFDGTPDKNVGIGSFTWQWKVSYSGASIDIDKSGPHKCYNVLAVPVAPWYSSTAERPWVSALDVVCAPAPWAGGTTTPGEAAASVTAAINVSGKFAYDILTMDENYVDEANKLQLTKVIDRINGADSLGPQVNCTDCASITMTFANLVGCELWSSKMGSKKAFSLNEVVLIGLSGSGWFSFARGGFGYHEVAWSGACGDGDMIYDACLRVDGDGDPSVDPRIPVLPTGMIFSDGNKAAPYVYRECLSAPSPTGYDRCKAKPKSAIRRNIY